MPRCVRRVIAILVLAQVLGALPAWAGEDDAGKLTEAAALVEAMAAAHKSKDVATLGTQAAKAVELHNAIQDKSLRGKLLKALGTTLKSRHYEGAHIATLEALAGLDDAKAAWKLLKRAVPGPKDEEITEVHKAALQAVDKLAPESALKTLEDLAEKAKNYEAGALAIGALGSFGKYKKRAAVLETLVKLISRFKPPTTGTVGAEAQKRWGALGAPLVLACNELTGRKERDPDSWLALWREHKKKPEALFVDQ